MTGASLRMTGLALLVAAPAFAQRADSLLAMGLIAAAESEFYAASAARPRDPVARARLGQFIAARGGTRAGAVLLEEARQFGGDSASIARALAPLYARLGDYKALAALEPSPLTRSERARAEYLALNSTGLTIRGTSVRIPYRAGRGSGIGTVLVRIGRAEIAATIDPEVTGLTLPKAMRADVLVFGDSTSAIGVVTARIGSQVFENISVVLTAGDESVRIGFDVLQGMSPTFSPQGGQITLQRPERRWRPGAGTRVPALYDETGLRLLFSGGWTPSSAPNTARLLSGRAWTWDARRGDVVLLTP
jgi:hypothetical protein